MVAQLAGHSAGFTCKEDVPYAEVQYCVFILFKKSLVACASQFCFLSVLLIGYFLVVDGDPSKRPSDAQEWESAECMASRKPSEFLISPNVKFS